MLPVLVLILLSLVLATIAQVFAGGAVAIALLLTLLVGGAAVLAVNRR
ncbi:MAG: hypothetical protein WAM11_02470 [Cyanobium sp.]